MYMLFTNLELVHVANSCFFETQVWKHFYSQTHKVQKFWFEFYRTVGCCNGHKRIVVRCHKNIWSCHLRQLAGWRGRFRRSCRCRQHHIRPDRWSGRNYAGRRRRIIQRTPWTERNCGRTPSSSSRAIIWNFTGAPFVKIETTSWIEIIHF